MSSDGPTRGGPGRGASPNSHLPHGAASWPSTLPRLPPTPPLDSLPPAPHPPPAPAGRPTAGGRGVSWALCAAPPASHCSALAPAFLGVQKKSAPLPDLPASHQAGLELVAGWVVTVAVKPVSRAHSDVGTLLHRGEIEACGEHDQPQAARCAGWHLGEAGWGRCPCGNAGSRRVEPSLPGSYALSTPSSPGAPQAPPLTWLPVRARHSGTGPKVLRHKEGRGSEHHG